MRKQEGALSVVIAEMRDATGKHRRGRIGVGDLVGALDERGYGAALALLPLLELTPIGGIPGFPTMLALSIGIITARMLMGYEHLWVPDWIGRRTFDADRAESALQWLRPIANRIDAKLHERLVHLAGPAGRRIAGVAILLVLLTVPPLEFVPFATSAPMIVISTYGLALLFRDGLLMLLAFIGTGTAAALAFWVLLIGNPWF
ncbi:exopolysaccharide biosynthesis protein (plasmid) [Roseivivax marinus]|uniref:exopolysaccharide biosynthesis protein n=1 Tax=Roseivivax marinus TaxID=1379903 RepID=UPI001F04B3BA|nr:exopolysaccharide biosynthesis protein [Roseivivax marinus]UMA67119.1 exopolysaccharide biosynthesis protein [Roseivivax marinus]